MSILSLILCFAALSFGMFCDLTVKKWYNLSDITTCLRGPDSPLPEYGDQFYDTLVEWQKNNIYVDYNRDPTFQAAYTTPLPFGSGFDLLKEFSASKARFDSHEIPLFDFYNELQISLVKLRDGHVAAFSPCLTYFFQKPPFDYKVLKNSSGTSVVPYFEITKVFGDAPTGLVGKVITALTWNGNAGEKVSPPQAFSNWAEKYSKAGFSPHARFNDALVKLSNPQSLYLSNNPLQNPATISLTYSAYTVDASGNPVLSGATEEIELEWGVDFLPASAEDPQDINNLALLCPPTSSVSDSHSNLLRPLTSLSIEEQRIQNESLAAVEAIAHALPGWHPSSHVRFSPDEVDELKQRVGRQLEVVKDRARHSHSNSRHKMSGVGSSASASTRTNANTCDFALASSLDPNSDNLEVLCEDEGSKYNFSCIPALKLARMYIGAFQPDDMKDFVTNLITSVQVFNTLKAAGLVTDLIVDVRGNGGGSDIATVLAMKALFHDTVISDSESSVKLQDNDNQPGGLAFEYLSMVGEEAVMYRYGTQETVTDISANPVSVQFANIAGVTPTTYQRPFSKPFMLDSSPGVWDSTWPTLVLEPQHILLVSDGVCGSNCAVFTKKVRESRAARIFGYSKDPTSTAAYSLGSVPAFVLTSDVLEVARASGQEQGAPDGFDANFPPTPVAQDVRYGFSVDREFSLDPARRNEIIYFSGDPVHDIIPEFSYREYMSPAAVEALLKTIHARYIATPLCFSGEVEVAECTPAGTPIDHALYGHPCESNVFDTNQCVFSRCQPSYYLTGPTTCSPVFSDGNSGGDDGNDGDDGDDGDTASILTVTKRANICIWITLLGLLMWVVGI